MKMPKVKECSVTECAYNSQQKCHALAITVGDSASHAMCDTFCQADSKGGDPGTIGGVGACKVSECRFNTNLECSAADIEVGSEADQADCLTFQPR